MKKRTKVIIGVAVGLVVVIGGFVLFGGKGKKEATDNPKSDIEYFNVEGVDQVFINGTVTPVRSEEFMKDAALGKLGDLEVKNGDIVKEGTLLYQYVDPNSDREISEMKMNIQNTQAERDKAARQRDLEMKQLGQGVRASEEGEGEGGMADTSVNRESIELKYDLAGYDIRLQQMNQQLNEILEKQVNKVTAPFTGKVSIPQEKTRESAIMNLISEEYFVVGAVNEKDVDKLKESQQAEIRTISDNRMMKGKITYVAEMPNAGTSSEGGDPSGGGNSSLSNYTVKLSIDNAKDLKNGFHVQAAVNLSDKKIKIPEKAIHFDKDQAYVLVDDFGTVLKKTIEIVGTKDALGKEVEVNSGLESLDKVIVKSGKKLKNGDILPTGEEMGPAAEGVE